MVRSESVRQCLLCTKVKHTSKFRGNKAICMACEDVLSVKKRNRKSR